MSLALAGWARQRLPDRAVPAVAGCAGDIATACQRRRRGIAAANIRWLTGADDPGYARRLFRNFAYCNSDVLRLPRLDARDVLRLTDDRYRQSLATIQGRTRGALLVGGHLGNFELAAVSLAAAGLRAAALVEAIDPARDAFFAQVRMNTGLRLFTADRHGVLQARAWLRDGGVLVVAGDRPLASPRRLRVPFGQGWRDVPMGPAWLALTTRALITTGHLVRATARGGYTGGLDDPIETEAFDADARGIVELTRLLAKRSSDAAVRFADQWFVFDPGWTSPPQSS
jgi:KDO2-lipid IV(A) lauroyltransferase